MLEELYLKVSIFTNNNANDGQAMYLGSALFCKFIGNNNTNTTIVTPVLSVTNYTSTYKSGEKVVFNLTANNTNYNGINTTIKIYQNNKLIGTYYSLTGDGWTVDLNPGIYTAVLSLTLHPEIASVNGSINVEKATLNFTSLNETINGNNNSTIYLMNDYLFNEESDQDFITGIYINRNLTIYGNNITIDGNHMARIFNATNFTLTVKFYNITFINGNTTRGGAIYGGDAYYCTFIGNHGQWHGGAIADGNAYNCIFQGNSAGTEGGAILAGNAYNCIFNNNSAKWGGAVFYGSLYNCNFTNNYAIGGGAVFRVNLTNCSLTNNRAEDFGGAVCEAINGFNTIFTNNSAPRGGAILLGQLNNCYFYNNTGEEGGALCNCTVYNSIFADNNGLYGGAIYNTTAFNSIFTNNNASNGGAFYGFNITNATNCTFTNNTASEGQAMYGGNSILCIFNGNDCMNTTIVNVYLNVTNYTSTYNSGAKLIFDLIGNDVYYNDYIVTIKIYKDDTLIKTATGLTGSGWIVDLDYRNYTAVLSIDTHPDVSPVNATITVNKMSTKIIASSTTTVYNVKKELVITLKDAQGKIISGLPVTVKLASSKNYKTDKNGQIKIDISTLTPKAYNGKITYQGDKNYIESTKTVKVTVKKANPKITATAKTYKLNVKTKKYQIILKNNKNQVLKSAKVTLKVNGKTFTAKTNSKGIAGIVLSLNAGSYPIKFSFEGDSVYPASSGSKKIIVSYNTFGVYVFAANMKSMDLKKISSYGIRNIFLSYYAFEYWGKDEVKKFISNAKDYGIRVHIWMQCFYEGSWINPSTCGNAYKQAKIDEAVIYAKFAGVGGIHLDYIRYPGTAYRYSDATSQITNFVKNLVTAVKAVNKNIIVSAALMPETNVNPYYYGQDSSQMGKYLDVLMPMAYKGNYHQTTSWLTTTARYFASHCGTAQVWLTLQAYYSDSDVRKLPAKQLKADSQASLDGGVQGVVFFRHEYVNYFNMSSLVIKSSAATNIVGVSVQNSPESFTLSDIITAASTVKSYYSANSKLPNNVKIGTKYVPIAEYLYYASLAIFNIYEGNHSTIDSINANILEPDNPDLGDSLSNTYFNINSYVDSARRTYSYILNNEQGPNYSTLLSTQSDVRVSFNSLIESFSTILDYYGINTELPSYIIMTTGSSSTISSIGPNTYSSSSFATTP